MKDHTKSKSTWIRLLEFSIVATVILLFLSKLLFWLTHAINSKPEWLDYWLMCSMLEQQVTRILGLNPGGIWEKKRGGVYYPFHTVSMLFCENSEQGTGFCI